MFDFNDPKGFQGNINNQSYEERLAVQEIARKDYHLANEAIKLENEGNHKESINKWREIFGLDFPEYF